jgi:hypothetical protein
MALSLRGLVTLLKWNALVQRTWAREGCHGDFVGAGFVEDFDLVAVGVDEGFDDGAMELSNFFLGVQTLYSNLSGKIMVLRALA